MALLGSNCLPQPEVSSQTPLAHAAHFFLIPSCRSTRPAGFFSSRRCSSSRRRAPQPAELSSPQTCGRSSPGEPWLTLSRLPCAFCRPRPVRPAHCSLSRTQWLPGHQQPFRWPWSRKLVLSSCCQRAVRHPRGRVRARQKCWQWVQFTRLFGGRRSAAHALGWRAGGHRARWRLLAAQV